MPSPPLRLFCSNSTHPVLAALVPAYEDRSGESVAITVDSGKAMIERITAGEAGDVVILGSDVLEAFAHAGIVIAGSRRPFARTRVGLGVRRGFPRPKIDTVEVLRASLLAARSIAHTLHGKSGRYIPGLLEKLGIAEEMRARTVTRPTGHIGPVVVAGEADFALQQLPELLAVEGLEVVGLLPEPVQQVFESSSGIFAASKKVDAARAMLDFLVQPTHRNVFVEKGLEQVSTGAPGASPCP